MAGWNTTYEADVARGGKWKSKEEFEKAREAGTRPAFIPPTYSTSISKSTGSQNATTKQAGNTAAQEAFISSLRTEGALDPGSGFSRSFMPGETNAQYAARLEAWKKGKGGGAAASAGIGGGTVPEIGPAAAGLTAAAPGGPGGLGGAEAPAALISTMNELRQGLGQRIFPMESAALAGLRKIY